MVNGLLKTAQGIPPGATTTITPVQDATLQLSAMKCLVGVLRSMGDWMNKQLLISDANLNKIHEFEEGNESSAEGVEETHEGSEARIEPVGETSEAATFEQRRAYKLELQVSSEA